MYYQNRNRKSRSSEQQPAFYLSPVTGCLAEVHAFTQFCIFEQAKRRSEKSVTQPRFESVRPECKYYLASTILNTQQTPEMYRRQPFFNMATPAPSVPIALRYMRFCIHFAGTLVLLSRDFQNQVRPEDSLNFCRQQMYVGRVIATICTTITIQTIT